MKTTIESEFKRRTDLINDKSFIKLCAENAIKLGISAKQWNENKMAICLLIANEFCVIENKLSK